MAASYCCDELSNIQNWATANNLKLNCQKSKEIIFRARSVRGKSVQLPPPCQSIERTDKLTVLGVVINDPMTAVDHVGYLLSSCSMQFTVHVEHVAESWHSRNVAEGHLPSNCDDEDTVLCSSMVRLLFSS